MYGGTHRYKILYYFQKYTKNSLKNIVINEKKH